jgi:hypothetical protein
MPIPQDLFACCVQVKSPGRPSSTGLAVIPIVRPLRRGSQAASQPLPAPLDVQRTVKALQLLTGLACYCQVRLAFVLCERFGRHPLAFGAGSNQPSERVCQAGESIRLTP